MTLHSLARTSSLALALLLGAACASTAAPKPSQRGDWHWEGASRGLFATTDGGDFGDTDVFAAEVTGGRFVSDQLLVEGVLSIDDTNVEDDAGNETDLTTAEFGGGVRYYPKPEGSSRPYFGARAGFSHFNVDDDVSGADESDTSPFVEARLGLEAFVGDSSAVDLGISWQDVFSRSLGGVEDDVSTFAVFVGFSLWM